MGKLDTPPDSFTPDWITQLDGRRGIAQTMKERYRQFASDLGGDLSYAQASLVSRALWLEFWLQQQEQAMANGDDVDMGRWTQAVNSLQGILTKLGLKRQTRDVPSLNEYLNQRGGSQ